MGIEMSVPNRAKSTPPKDPVGQRRPLLAGGILLFGIAAGLAMWKLKPPSNPDDARVSAKGTQTRNGPRFAVNMPFMRMANEVVLPDDTMVIGLIVDGRPRAYHLGVFRSPGYCVVNDLINDIPITVTYDEPNQIVQVFTDRYRGNPLELENRGKSGSDKQAGTQKMIVSIQSSLFYQETGKPVETNDPTIKPISTYPFEKTTWKQWKDAHPNTEIYTRFFGAE